MVVTAGTPVPLVSVNIPCYRQLHHLRRAVDSLRAQTLPAIEINLLDDGASDEYAQYVQSLGDARVRYHRNAERLGAMGNMFSAIAAGRGQLTMAFHEDDLLSTTYLESAAGILERHPTCAFVACQLREFTDEPSAADLGAAFTPPAFEIFATAADLVRGILRGVEPMFGSVVYRRPALDGVQPDHAGYATLVDRPFLLSIMNRGWTAAVIQSPLVWYRHHGEGDTRHRAMTADHILHLLRTYRAALPASWSSEDRAAFFRYTGYWLFELYRLTPADQRPPVWKYLFRAWREGLYDPRARGRFGVRQIQRALLNQTS
jgi:glycosyltransferase involved in cell wall biosynthesis